MSKGTFMNKNYIIVQIWLIAAGKLPLRGIALVSLGRKAISPEQIEKKIEAHPAFPSSGGFQSLVVSTYLPVMTTNLARTRKMLESMADAPFFEIDGTIAN